MSIDLHTHSNRSDGTDSPTELVENAKAIGLDIVALTDHDTAVGWDEAEEAAERVGIRLVKGMEVSTELAGRSVHLLAYGLDREHAGLIGELEKVIESRTGRIPKFIEKFRLMGIEVTEEEILAKVGDADAVGRPHIADVLVERGIVATRDEAFDSLLSPGGGLYVGRYSIALPSAIELVKAAGGKAVLAHPWSRGSHKVLTPEVIAGLVEHGLDGIEVNHADHDAEARVTLHQIAKENDLIVTGSSDYHGSGKSSDFRLGANTTDPAEFERLIG
ncbi:MAG TPA: PHP domain-containing protein [Aeromicrobium sp.]|nr:PHP domain-containing protein [Aeromicrobium sp.]HKY57001.1 PHP domain-containing protein [Aeromicrobium sp.]